MKTMKNQNAVKHGLKKNKHYSRWRSFVQRCYDKTNKSYPEYGGKGIKVEEIWHPSNWNGVKNFITWVEEQLKHEPELRDIKFKVIRNDVSKNFGPDNCSLVHEKLSYKNRSTTKLDFNTVVELRQLKKINQDLTLPELEERYNLSGATISRALRGVTWGSVDDTESPIGGMRDRTLT